MAVANHIGHDKRGNKSYVRDRKGNEVIEVAEELVKAWDGDTPTYQ
jgi:type I restriction enzyme M protein